MSEVNAFLRPITNLLPPEAAAFLESGGWWLVLGILALVLLLLLVALLRRLFRLLFGTREAPPPDMDAQYRINLEECPLPVAPPGEQRLYAYHIPVRLRLVVLAPAGTEVDIDATAAEKLLDRILPGLGDQARHDRPRVRIWPGQLSHEGFNAAFHRRVGMPHREGEPSRWVLVSGTAMVGRRPVLVGLGLWADKTCTIDRLTLAPHQWLDVLRVRRSED